MIKFPRMHIAQSVVNRIINVANQVPRDNSTNPIELMPNVPDPTRQGQAIDAALQQPPAPMAMPEGGDDVMVAASLDGTSPAEAVALQGALEDD